MTRRSSLVLLLAAFCVAVAVLFLLFGDDWFDGASTTRPQSGADPTATARSADAGDRSGRAAEDAAGVRVAVGEIEQQRLGNGIRGVVLDARTLQPLAGVEVAAMKTPPAVERFVSRLRNAFFRGEGLWTQSSRPAEILGKTVTGPDGSFELRDIDPGTVFLDARSDFTFVRSPVQVRVAAGESVDGVELLGSPGGRVQGVVHGPDGAPLPGAVVSLRPGLNAFLGQLTQRRYRWLEASTDAEGRYDLPGVPEGGGYVLSAGGPGMALEEVFGVAVREAQVTVVDIDGHVGARIAGKVVDPDGTPIPGAHVAMVYLDVSRVLFSADGRDEPITTGPDGGFELKPVAAGRIGLVAIAEDLAPSPILDLTVVDGGDYSDLLLQLDPGAPFEGTVVDDLGRPLSGVTVEIRPMERPNDPDVVKMALKVREVEATTGADGRFRAEGIDAARLFVQFSKPSYVTEVRFGIERDREEPFQQVLTRGVTVKGRVTTAAGEPLTRFRVDTRSREVDPETGEEVRRPQRRGPPWGQQGGIRLAEGERLGDRNFGDRWKEVQSADGRFELEGLPPGKVRVRVRAEGFRDPDNVEVVLAPGEESEELSFEMVGGAVASGIVVDASTGSPVPDATVTAYRGDGDDGQQGGRAPFRMQIDPEDFDLLGLAEGSRRSARTDSRGRFEIQGLGGGTYRFTGRHPDLAKASVTEVELLDGQNRSDLRIELDAGGGIEGTVTGAGGLPVGDAIIVALSVAAGSLESSSTDEVGRYRIEGLAPGQYVVFKSRMDERATNIGYDLLGNMRLKTVGVRRGEVSRLDIVDETENGVRVFGQIRDGGEPVSRAMVTALGADRQGLFGMGIRAQPTREDGTYEMVLEPGDYFFQVTRFAQRPQQASLSVEVPEGVRQLRYDIELPRAYVAGRVVDSAGVPVPGIRISAGVVEGGMEDAPGLLGIVLKNGVAQTRTGDDGTFKLNSLSGGVYRIVASGRSFGRRGGNAEFGEAAVEDVVVDADLPVDGLEIVLPRAGSISGLVVDGNGTPVRGAEIVASRDGGEVGGGSSEQQIMDLFGVQAAPVRSDAEGRFTIQGVTPGSYRVRADADGLSPGVADEVLVVAESETPVQLQVVRGATLKIRARNVDGSQIPFANVTVLDGRGKPLASRVSVMSVFRGVFGGRDKTDDSGWYTVGNVPPDTYTVIIEEKDQPTIRVTREIVDGEEVEWDVDVATELEAAGRGR